MKTSNILLLALVGGAMYYFYKKSKEAKATTEKIVEHGYAPGGDVGIELALPNAVVPYNDLGLPASINRETGAAIEQTLDAAGKPINTAYQVRFAIKGIPNII